MIVDKGPTTRIERQQMMRRRRLVNGAKNLAAILFIVVLVYLALFYNPPIPWSFQG